MSWINGVGRVLLGVAAAVALLAAGAAALPRLVGTASPGASSTQPLMPLGPATPAEAPWDGCSGVGTLIDRVPPTIEAVAPASSSIFAGTVVDVGPGQWNTVDGKPRSNNLEDIRPFDVMRLLRVVVDQGVLGSSYASAATLWIRGGTIGCSIFSYSDYPDEIKVGQRFVFFVDEARPRINVEVEHVRLMWPIDATGSVQTPENGLITIADLSSRVAEALGN